VVLDLRGQHVASISTDPRPTLSLGSGWQIAVEAPAFLSRGSVRTGPALPTAPASWSSALQPDGAAVLSAVAFTSGGLRIAFGTGPHLTRATGSAVREITGPPGCGTSAVAPGAGLALSP